MAEAAAEGERRAEVAASIDGRTTTPTDAPLADAASGSTRLLTRSVAAGSKRVPADIHGRRRYYLSATRQDETRLTFGAAETAPPDDPAC